MFVDHVKMTIESGKGGDGMSAFRREKYVPKGGPSGGDGGRGGHVYFEGDEGLSTLLELHYDRHRKAEDGGRGENKKKHGKDGGDLVLKVPLGTTVFSEETGKVLADITRDGQRARLLEGGRGGRGNARFASGRRPAPTFAEKGEPGKTLAIRVELKLLADVGLVGLPSVGKSTLISTISASKPKIAAYPFTTLTPNLGVVDADEAGSFVVADLPGLIEGASEGKGLGHQFLRHVERTRLLLHVIDISAIEGRDPYEDFQSLNKELKSYGAGLEKRPQIVVANKMDAPDAEANLERFKEKVPAEVEIVPISAYTRWNLDRLMKRTAERLAELKATPLYEEDAYEETVVYRYEGEAEPFTIERAEDGVLEVKGERVERLFAMTDFNNDEAVWRFARALRAMGVEKELRKLGVKTGGTVRILGYEFELKE